MPFDGLRIPIRCATRQPRWRVGFPRSGTILRTPSKRRPVVRLHPCLDPRDVEGQQGHVESSDAARVASPRRRASGTSQYPRPKVTGCGRTPTLHLTQRLIARRVGDHLRHPHPAREPPPLTLDVGAGVLGGEDSRQRRPVRYVRVGRRQANTFDAYLAPRTDADDSVGQLGVQIAQKHFGASTSSTTLRRVASARVAVPRNDRDTMIGRPVIGLRPVYGLSCQTPGLRSCLVAHVVSLEARSCTC